MHGVTLLSYVAVVGLFLDQNFSRQEQELYFISILSPHSTRLAENVNMGFLGALLHPPVMWCKETGLGKVHLVPAFPPM